MRDLGRALRGLTLRGRSFVLIGLIGVGLGLAAGAEDLLRVGVFLLVLPLVSVGVVLRTRYRLACERRVVPGQVAAGTAATCVLRLDNVSRLPSGVLLMEDALAYSLGGRPRFVLDRIEAHGRREVGYPVRSEVRGRYRLGPLSVRLTDPFGLCELTRSFTAVDQLTVTPVVTPLVGASLGGDRAGGGESSGRSVSSVGEDDAATREYRHGDDLRRVHWRSTARTGELMVRREEQPWQSRATVLLDGRRASHTGDGPGSSYEWSVAAAASVLVHLVRGQLAVRLVDEHGRDLATGTGAVVQQVALERLSVVEPSATRDLALATTALRGEGSGVIVALLGRLDHSDAAQLAALRAGGRRCVALACDTAAFAVSGPRASEGERKLHAEAVAVLRAAGWRVVSVSRNADLAELWPEVVAGRGSYRAGENATVESLTAAGRAPLAGASR